MSERGEVPSVAETESAGGNPKVREGHGAMIERFHHRFVSICDRLSSGGHLSDDVAPGVVWQYLLTSAERGAPADPLGKLAHMRKSLEEHLGGFDSPPTTAMAMDLLNIFCEVGSERSLMRLGFQPAMYYDDLHQRARGRAAHKKKRKSEGPTILPFPPRSSSAS